MRKEQEEVVIEKSTHLAFFSLRDCELTPFRKPNGRVAFRVKGDISKILTELNQNPSVPILDFMQRYETIRSIIFSLKAR